MGTVERARHELLIIQDCVWAGGGGGVVLLYCMFISTVKMPAGISRRGVSERKWGGVSGVVVVVRRGCARMEIDQCACNCSSGVGL